MAENKKTTPEHYDKNGKLIPDEHIFDNDRRFTPDDEMDTSPGSTYDHLSKILKDREKAENKK